MKSGKIETLTSKFSKSCYDKCIIYIANYKYKDSDSQFVGYSGKSLRYLLENNIETYNQALTAENLKDFLLKNKVDDGIAALLLHHADSANGDDTNLKFWDLYEFKFVDSYNYDENDHQIGTFDYEKRNNIKKQKIQKWKDLVEPDIKDFDAHRC